MTSPGNLQDLSRLDAPRLISLDEGDAVQTEETKLINVSETHCEGLSQSTLAEMMLVDSTPITSHHEDLVSLVNSPDADSLSTIQCPRSTPAGPQSLIANQLASSQDQLTSLTTITTFMAGLTYVDSLTSFHPSASPSEAQKEVVENDGLLAYSSLSSMRAEAVRNREVQTRSVAPVSSEAILHPSDSSFEPIISISEAEINATETVASPAADSPDTMAELPLTIASTDYISVTSSLSSIAPSISHSMDRNRAPGQEVLTTALGTRTTEDVIADLRHSLGSSFQPHRDMQNSSSSHLSGGSHSSDHTRIKSSRETEEESHGSDEEEDEGEGEEGDEFRPSTKTRKFSERKRRMNAIADQYILTLVEKSAKKDNEVKPGDESRQSAKWLVNQSENREIISSPREYQTELFERAKEKNIIAVLDTGLSEV